MNEELENDDDMVTVRVPKDTTVLIMTATAEAEVIKAADIQPETKE
jgi:hypothetical protein